MRNAVFRFGRAGARAASESLEVDSWSSIAAAARKHIIAMFDGGTDPDRNGLVTSCVSSCITPGGLTRPY